MKQGFTLIELLVVIAIIGILAGTGTTVYSGYASQVRVSGAQNTLLSIYFQQEEFYEERSCYLQTPGGIDKQGQVINKFLFGASESDVYLSPIDTSKKNPYFFWISNSDEDIHYLESECPKYEPSQTKTYIAKAVLKADHSKFFIINDKGEKLDQDGNPW
tara:strand:- start:173 stop:652 length:480 start_codon:yes stop_codon:yes gene_type:complete